MENFNGQQVGRQLPRDVFLHLLMIVVLAMTAIYLGVLLFQFINIYIADVASDACLYSSCQDAVRMAVAFLIIVFPVLVWVTRFLSRDVAANPAKRDLWIRRWLLYLTLFVAGLIVIGDLIALVNGYLQGELTLAVRAQGARGLLTREQRLLLLLEPAAARTVTECTVDDVEDLGGCTTGNCGWVLGCRFAETSSGTSDWMSSAWSTSR